MLNKIKVGLKTMFWPTMAVLLIILVTSAIGAYFGMAAFTLVVSLMLLLFIAYLVGDYRNTSEETHQYLSDVDDEINGLLVRLPRHEWDRHQRELSAAKEKIMVAASELEAAINLAELHTVADLKGNMYHIMRGLER